MAKKFQEASSNMVPPTIPYKAATLVEIDHENLDQQNYNEIKYVSNGTQECRGFGNESAPFMRR